MNEIVEYNVTDAAISEMQSRYMGLVVKGLDDRAGLAAVHEARMVVKGTRCKVENKRKELKADALIWGQKVDAEARRITNLLEPIESHLEAEEIKVTAEKARIKSEAEHKARERAQGFVDAFAGVGVSMPFMLAMEMSDGDFFAKFTIAEDEHKKEQARIAKEKCVEQERLAAEKKAQAEEAARLAAERAEFERVQAEELKKRQAEYIRIKAENDKLEADRRALEEAKREQEVQAAIEQAKKDAAEKALKDAAEKSEREAREKADAERKAVEEAERRARLRPDKEKLLAYADALVDVQVPTCASDEATAILSEACKKVLSVKKHIHKAAKDL